ncbi:MAG: prepilin-type N-terminal cleavage/methylation domain-containing protein [Lachnospiraceae bacterium]|nr:prepilin-type N-terminal cleavage/methylation domain-containing protein [Lachnospiraceae bacterium]
MDSIKRDNKGFSLVELIVVVLIMAVIAVALAPQIFKWVENSRRSADMETKANLQAAMTVTIAADNVIAELIETGGAKLRVENSGATLTKGDGTTEFEASSATYKGLFSNLEENSLSELRTKSSESYILIEINAQPYITKTQYCDKDDNEIELE